MQTLQTRLCDFLSFLCYFDGLWMSGCIIESSKSPLLALGIILQKKRATDIFKKHIFQVSVFTEWIEKEIKRTAQGLWGFGLPLSGATSKQINAQNLTHIKCKRICEKFLRFCKSVIDSECPAKASWMFFCLQIERCKHFFTMIRILRSQIF